MAEPETSMAEAGAPPPDAVTAALDARVLGHVHALQGSPSEADRELHRGRACSA